MRIFGLMHDRRAVGVLFLIGSLGLSAGCGDETAAPTGGVPADAKIQQDTERAAREKAFGKSAMPPGTKKAAEAAAKN